MGNRNYSYNANRTLRKKSYININKNPKIQYYKSSPTTLVMVSVIFIILGVFTTFTQYKEKESYNALIEGGNYTYGKITDVYRRTNTRTTSTYYDISGTYNVDNLTYYFSFESDVKLEEGKKIKIFYDDDKPENNIANGEKRGNLLHNGIMCIIMGVIMGGAGIKKHYDKKAQS